ncbi:glutamine-hydrolyzing carbamoyl-phosphate synthase small subunit [Helicobacter sp. 11S02629-2]|uniref:glutamine-hydrolyzing carbamoyl-phosphate synthase small subunit n=1 Tax=Helicobacter sp. 11S02629-2 TaxID=1476195 RepID=UPI000BA630E7|nr:glutamine-hydrolyzing carbamoyl-phosphate synthase small subunit [Helicobacter sp. 11S02629-2]PAF45502.1 carbamoyl phosphate synthase small subunit [Helicobacter sp. 11S02629-2]
MSKLKPIYLYFSNGCFLEAKSFGSEGTKVGEAVFNTSMTGYQEITSDPSYAGQFVIFSMPEIGIVGTNDFDNESFSPKCKGIIVRDANEVYSSFRADEGLGDYLKKHDILGICDIDTRSLVKMLRKYGALEMIASTTISDKESLKAKLDSSLKIGEIDYIKEVSTKSAYSHTKSNFSYESWDYQEKDGLSKTIAAIDFGIKKNILHELVTVGFKVEVLPQDYDENTLIKDYKDKKIHAVFLSNGPGDPLILTNQVDKIKSLLAAKIPIFGICLGHQLLSIAHGYPTYKLKFGHHGANHPVKNELGLVEITSQNHNYNVPEEIEEVAFVTHRNLFDNTIEGLCYKEGNVFSVQHHPEASPGPKEASNIFAKFFAQVPLD